MLEQSFASLFRLMVPIIICKVINATAEISYFEYQLRTALNDAHKLIAVITCLWVCESKYDGVLKTC